MPEIVMPQVSLEEQQRIDQAPPPAEPVAAPKEEPYISLAKQVVKVTPRDVQQALKEKPVQKEAPPVAQPTPKAAPTPPTKPTPEVVKPNAEHFKTITAERDAARKELEDFKRRATDLEQTLAQSKAREGNLPGIQLTLQQREQELAELRQQLKVADLRKDPEFVEKYDTGRKHWLNRMVELGSTAVSKEELERIVRRGDADKLAEVADALPAGDRLKFITAMQEVERLDSQREIELSKADSTWEQIQQRRQQAHQEQIIQKSRSQQALGYKIIEDLTKAIPFIKDDAELLAKMKSDADGLSGFGDPSVWSEAEVLGRAIMLPAMLKINQAQETVLNQNKERITSLEVEVAKWEKIAKERGLTVENEDGGFATDAGDEDETLESYVPLSQRLVVKR